MCCVRSEGRASMDELNSSGGHPDATRAKCQSSRPSVHFAAEQLTTGVDVHHIGLDVPDSANRVGVSAAATHHWRTAAVCLHRRGRCLPFWRRLPTWFRSQTQWQQNLSSFPRHVCLCRSPTIIQTLGRVSSHPTLDYLRPAFNRIPEINSSRSRGFSREKKTLSSLPEMKSSIRLTPTAVR